MRLFSGLILAAFGLAVGLSLGLAGCAAGGMGEELPQSLGGLPADAPAPPKNAYKYPAVHDMPPARVTPTMSDADQIKLEKELQATRDRLEGKPGPAKKPVAARKKRAPAAKNQPLDIKSGQASGAAPKP
jgi:hypothetical protein